MLHKITYYDNDYEHNSKKTWPEYMYSRPSFFLFIITFSTDKRSNITEIRSTSEKYEYIQYYNPQTSRIQLPYK